MVKVALVVITDGRFDYLCSTLESLKEHIDYEFAFKAIINDQGDGGTPMLSGSHWALTEQFPDFKIISHKGRQGLTQAVRTAWTSIPENTDYVFHLEEDFTFNEDIDIETMIEVLKIHPYLTQMMLKRQPWSSEEIDAGGYIEMDPDAYEEHFMAEGCSCEEEHTVCWSEHRKFFSLNPCLIPKHITDLNWHDDNERGFTAQLFENPEAKSGILGMKFDPPKVHHIGVNRTHSGGDNGYGSIHLPA